MTTQHVHYQRVIESLEYLKLTQFQVHLDDVLKLVGTQKLSFLEGLLHLLDMEVAIKQQNVINSMVKVANLPHLKGLEAFDYDFNPSLRNRSNS